MGKGKGGEGRGGLVRKEKGERRGEERCVCAHTLDWLKSL